MINIARFFTLLFGFISIFLISEMVQKNHKHSEITFYEHFVGFSFLAVTIAISIWIYNLNYKKKEMASMYLKEILYIFGFVSGFTTIASFIGWC